MFKERASHGPTKCTKIIVGNKDNTLITTASNLITDRINSE
jgi:hypothetical protein